MRFSPSDSASERSAERRDASRIASSGGVTVTGTASTRMPASYDFTTDGGAGGVGTGVLRPQDAKGTDETRMRPARRAKRARLKTVPVGRAPVRNIQSLW